MNKNYPVSTLYIRNIYNNYYSSLSFKKIFLFIFREKGREEKEGERNINVWLSLTHPLLRTWPATQACALTGNWTNDTWVRRPVLSPLRYTSQGLFLPFFWMVGYHKILWTMPFYFWKGFNIPWLARSELLSEPGKLGKAIHQSEHNLQLL